MRARTRAPMASAPTQSRGQAGGPGVGAQGRGLTGSWNMELTVAITLIFLVGFSCCHLSVSQMGDSRFQIFKMEPLARALTWCCPKGEAKALGRAAGPVV